MARIESPQVNGFPLDEKGELDFSDLERKYAVSSEEGFENIIVVDNCPEVEEDARKLKLTNVLRNIFGASGTIGENGIYMPMHQVSETGKLKSQGYLNFMD